MTLDVVVVTRESSDHIESCLRRLPDDVSIYVIDNESSDGSAEIAERVADKVVRNPENRGFAAAANQGASMGSSDLVLFLNPDATIDATSLTALAAAFHDPSVAVSGPRLMSPDGREQRSWWPFPSPLATWLEALGFHRLRLGNPVPAGDVPFVVGACLLVRRSSFQARGGFAERFWLYGEGADLCQRLWPRGGLVRHIPEPCC